MSLAGLEEGAVEETKANFWLLASVSCKNKGELASVHYQPPVVSHPFLVLISFLVLGSTFLAFAVPKHLSSSRNEMKMEKLYYPSPGSTVLGRQRNFVNLINH